VPLHEVPVFRDLRGGAAGVVAVVVVPLLLTAFFAARTITICLPSLLDQLNSFDQNKKEKRQKAE